MPGFSQKLKVIHFVWDGYHLQHHYEIFKLCWKTPSNFWVTLEISHGISPPPPTLSAGGTAFSSKFLKVGVAGSEKKWVPGGS